MLFSSGISQVHVDVLDIDVDVSERFSMRELPVNLGNTSADAYCLPMLERIIDFNNVFEKFPAIYTLIIYNKIKFKQNAGTELFFCLFQ
jgi:hypothetical protein